MAVFDDLKNPLTSDPPQATLFVYQADTMYDSYAPLRALAYIYTVDRTALATVDAVSDAHAAGVFDEILLRVAADPYSCGLPFIRQIQAESGITFIQAARVWRAEQTYTLMVLGAPKPVIEARCDWVEQCIRDAGGARFVDV